MSGIKDIKDCAADGCTEPASYQAAYCVNHCDPRPEGLRDRFAMAALAGLLAGGEDDPDAEADADAAFDYADAMMARRRKA